MRNIAVFTVLVIMLNSTPFVAAQEETLDESPARPYTVAIGTSFGAFLGQAEEIVYPLPGYPAEKFSQLLWDIKPVIYTSLSLDLSRAQPMEKWGFISAFSMKIGFPGKSGKMEDRDWESIENDALTSFSVHDNYSNELLIFDANAGVSFPFRKVLLKTYVGMSFMRFSFTGQFGEGTYARSLGGDTYAPINDNPIYYSYSDWEKVINYSQNWLTTTQSISLTVFFNRFSSELSFTIGQVLFCVAVDEHLTRNTVFRDYMYGGLFIEPGYRLSFQANKRIEFSHNFSWRFLGGSRGNSWKGTIGSSDLTQVGESGSGLSLFDIGLCMKVYLRH